MTEVIAENIKLEEKRVSMPPGRMILLGLMAGALIIVFLASSIPVTIGNMIGGMICIALVLYVVHQKDLKAKES